MSKAYNKKFTCQTEEKKSESENFQAPATSSCKEEKSKKKGNQQCFKKVKWNIIKVGFPI